MNTDDLLSLMSISERISVIVSVSALLLTIVALLVGSFSFVLASFVNRRTKLDEINRQHDAEAFRLLSIAAGGPETYVVSEREIRGPLHSQQLIAISLLRQYPRQIPAMRALHEQYIRNAASEEGAWQPFASLRDGMKETLAALEGQPGR